MIHRKLSAYVSSYHTKYVNFTVQLVSWKQRMSILLAVFLEEKRFNP
jgi:hypothetical protein